MIGPDHRRFVALLNLARQFNARLMPDYDARVATYWWSVVVGGVSALVFSVWSVALLPREQSLPALGISVMAVVAGLVPVRIPRSNNVFTSGVIFVFLLLLLFGVEAATVACAAEALVGALRTSKRWTSRIGSPAMAALAMFSTGSVFRPVLDRTSETGWAHDALLLLSLIAFSLVYFFVDTLLATTIPRLKKKQTFLFKEFFSSFSLLFVAYVGSACVATFLFLSSRQSGFVALVAAIPIIVILVTTGHYFFRREEANDTIRRAREAELDQAARHTHELEVSERRFHSAFTHASIGMALVAFDGRIRQANASLRTLLGLPAGDLEGHRLDFASFESVDTTRTFSEELARVHSGQVEALSLELRTTHRDGTEIWVDCHCAFFSEADSAETWLILQLQDITARRRAQADLHYIAFHDSLTGLPNRHRFHEHLTRAISRARADPQHEFGVMFLDFDRFKLINDSMGHTLGDEFLIQVSRRIEENVRPGDMVARLGGDEFAVLAEHRASARVVVALADRLLDALRRPFRIGETDITTSASIGITFSALGYDAPEEVLRDADIAMYKAKAAGKARYALFDSSLHTEVAKRLRLEGDLRRALTNNELSVDYQPLCDLGSGKLVGFEALVRWHHPEFGTIGPAAFIPVAEESGAMVQLTDFVLHRACRALKRWQLLAPEFAELSMHVNIAGNDIASAGFVHRVTHAIVESRLQPQHLTIELTENILMERFDESIGMLTQLHELGIVLSVDDFGTGYSSLSHLSTLPIDSLKIDMSFVSKLSSDSKEAAVICAIILLGKSLGKMVIAEGIETMAQLTQLRELGCDVGQGYYLSYPLPPDEIDALLDKLRASKPGEQANLLSVRQPPALTLITA